MSIIMRKYKTLPVQLKSLFWLTVCTFLQKGISIITVPIFTRIMSTAEYGIYNEFISWENIIQLFTTLSLHTGIFNTSMIKNEEKHDIVVSTYLGLTTVLTVAAFGIFMLFRDGVSKLMGLDNNVIYLLFVNLLLAPALNLWVAQQRFEYKYARLVVYTVLYSIINPLICYFAVIYSKNAAYARIVSFTVVSACFYGLIYVSVFVKGKVFYNGQLWKDALRVNIPLIPHFLSASVLNQADRLMIGNMVGDSEAGIYSAGYSAAMMLQLVISSVNASITPWVYKKIKDGCPGESRRILNISCVLMLGAVVLFMLFAPECMWILAPSEYHDAVWLFPPLTASVFYIYIYGLFCNVELYYEKSVYVTISSCMAAGINIVLNYFLIPTMGYTVAGYTTLVSYMICAGAHMAFSKKIVREKSIISPIDSRFVIILSIILVVLTVVINWLYKSAVSRYIFSLFIIVLVLVFKNRIKILIEEVKQRKHG